MIEIYVVFVAIFSKNEFLYSNLGSSDSDFTRTTNGTGRVPNTNIHSTEGSNPMWMQAYENEWYKGDDSIR